MKTLFFISIMMAFLFEACNTYSTGNSIREFIPGTYVLFTQHEFGTIYDTVTISVQNSVSNEYLIISKWRYERILDGVPIEPEHKTVKATAIYEAKSKLLNEPSTGGNYSFDIKQNTMFYGTQKYQKLK